MPEPDSSNPELPAKEESKTNAEAGHPVKGAASPEEQMAEFEEALKHSDWGHQPC